MPIYLKDTFTGTNGTAIAGRSLEVGGTTWTERLFGTAFADTIQDNKASLVQGGSGSTGYFVATTSVSDETVTVTAQADNGEHVFDMIVRESDVSNLWLISPYITGDSLRIIERNGGSNTLRASVSVALSVNTDYAVVAVCSGSTITASIGEDSVAYASATHNQTAKGFGFGCSNGAADATGLYDNFQVGTADATYTPLRAAKLNDQGPRFVNNILRRGL